MKRWLLIPAALGGFLLAVVLMYLGAPRAQATRRSVAAASPNAIEELRDEVAELRRLANRPQIVVVPTASAAAGIPAATEGERRREPEAEPERDQPATPEALRELQLAQVEKTAAALDERLATEPVDVAWEQSTLRQIRETVGTRVPSGQLLDARCTTSLCRVSIAYEPGPKGPTLTELVERSAPFDQGTIYAVSRDPNPKTRTLYVLREGHQSRTEAK